jgi:hypothetical protein
MHLEVRVDLVASQVTLPQIPTLKRRTHPLDVVARHGRRSGLSANRDVCRLGGLLGFGLGALRPRASTLRRRTHEVAE